MKKALSIILILIGVFFVYFWYITEATGNLKTEIIASVEQKMQNIEAWENNYIDYLRFVEGKSPNYDLETFEIFLAGSKTKAQELATTNKFNLSFDTQGNKAREFEIKFKALENEYKQTKENLESIVTAVNCQEEAIINYKKSYKEYQTLVSLENFNSKTAQELLESGQKNFSQLQNLAQCESKFDKKHNEEISKIIQLAKDDFISANNYIEKNGSNISTSKLQEVVQTYVSKLNLEGNAQTIFAKLHTFKLPNAKIAPEIRQELTTYKNTK